MRSIKDNKKAQEFSITTLVVLVLAIIILVLVVLGFWKGWDYIFSKLGVLPNDLTIAVETCRAYSKNQVSTTSFCEYKPLRINGVRGLWNCNGVYAQAQGSLTQEAIGFNPDMTSCKLASDYCASINIVAGFKETIINGEPCLVPSK